MRQLSHIHVLRCTCTSMYNGGIVNDSHCTWMYRCRVAHGCVRATNAASRDKKRAIHVVAWQTYRKFHKKYPSKIKSVLCLHNVSGQLMNLGCYPTDYLGVYSTIGRHCNDLEKYKRGIISQRYSDTVKMGS